MLRDAEEVMGRIRRVPGVQYTVLVPNVREAERVNDFAAGGGTNLVCCSDGF
jgi:hydroxymethylglutaryl-CoA lyase